jgi:hypothetical protein
MDKLADILADYEKSLEMAHYFIGKSQEKYVSGKPVGTQKDIESFAHIIRTNAERTLRIIHAAGESPLEKIFLTSLFMCSIKSDDNLGMVMVYPFEDANVDMETYANTIPHAKTMVDQLGHEGALQRLDHAEKAGAFGPGEWAQNFGFIWNYGLLENESKLHITPQAQFPNLLPNGKGARADVLVWCPAKPKFKVIVECDSYSYHDNHSSFDSDRQRSRAFQAAGFRVLQYSGGEIYRDPAKVAFDLYSELLNSLKAAPKSRSAGRPKKGK